MARTLSYLLLWLVSGGLPGAALADLPLSGILSDKGLKGFVKVDRLPVSEDTGLAQGREIWGETCFKCHGGNKAIGAPKITSTGDWAPRIEQGMDVLFDHVINGFTGPTYSIMPARGGTDLSDDDLRKAMSFMVWASGGADLALDYLAKTESQ